ncbi:heavy metal-binding domain-containing protein [Lentzea sp. BCCO 10_0061]|uniref:Heavy metal-binding domain-containing protein n=1 Tax=Lentzea sokolovensis TaxID=3095429 RepID=A0ABU4V6J4_9PSEU|nr:heavy metal-binding domain-containing protein [Lentzea sp. BCCO 10_0061]MDX8147417.1 heavy metal-binding domain-containing protein [Lentzea sp. BCCO 10_0061]
MKNLGRNAELPVFTQGLYTARELAMERMQAEAAALEAEGIVGVQLLQHIHSWSGHVTEFFAVGRRCGRSATITRSRRRNSCSALLQLIQPLAKCRALVARWTSEARLRRSSGSGSPRWCACE